MSKDGRMYTYLTTSFTIYDPEGVKVVDEEHTTLLTNNPNVNLDDLVDKIEAMCRDLMIGGIGEAYFDDVDVCKVGTIVFDGCTRLRGYKIFWEADIWQYSK